MILPPIVMLPGMMLDERVYAEQVRQLSPFTRVIIGNITSAPTIQDLAEDVLHAAPPQFAMAGLSMGGIVALEIWRRAPQRVTHLALIDTTPYADRPERQEIRFEQIAAVDAGNLRQVLTQSMKPLYLARKNRESADLLNQILEMGIDLGPDVFRRQSMALAHRADSTATIATIDCPSLVLCGREDALCPVEFHRTMADAIPRADLVILAECGHLAVMEEPNAVASALDHLLRRPA